MEERILLERFIRQMNENLPIIDDLISVEPLVFTDTLQPIKDCVLITTKFSVHDDLGKSK